MSPQVILVLMVCGHAIHAVAEQNGQAEPVISTPATSRQCKAYARSGQQCSIPFVYKGVSYHKCTDVDNPPGRYWCSLTPDFDADKQWKRCAGVICDDCNVYTTHGQKCVFPFIFKGKTYNYCTDVENKGNLWCSLTSNYNNRWGRCGDTLCGECTVRTALNKQCRFPFTYKGVSYEHCTVKDNRNRPWCSLNGRSRRPGTDWDKCAENQCSEQPVLPAPLSSTPKNRLCTVYTVHGKECVIPFVYKGVSYPDATDVDNKGVKWCSLTANYDIDRKYERYRNTVCRDPCASDPCENGGNCTNQPYGPTDFTCECATGYMGSNCSTEDD